MDFLFSALLGAAVAILTRNEPAWVRYSLSLLAGLLVAVGLRLF